MLLYLACHQNPRLIDLTVRAANVERCLDRISEGCGLNVRAKGSIKGEVLTIRVKQVPVSSLMDEIAYVLHASWTRTGDSIELARTTADTKLLQKRDSVQRSEALATAIEKRVAAAEKLGTPYMQAERAYNSISAMMGVGPLAGTPGAKLQENLIGPSEELLSTTLSKIGAPALIDNTKAAPLVLSNKPNPRQQWLGNGLDEAIRKFGQIQEAYRAYADKPLGSAYTSNFYWKRLFEPAQSETSIEKVLLTFVPLGRTTFAKLGVYGNKGELRGDASFVFDPDSEMAKSHVPSEVEQVLKAIPSDPIALSEASVNLRKLGALGPKQLGEARPWIGSLADFDPLAFECADALLGCGDLQVVACMDDRLTSIGRESALDGRISARAFLERAELSGLAEVGIRRKTLLVRPDNPVGSEETRVDREELKRLLNSSLVNGKIPLKDWSLFCLREGVAGWRSVAVRHWVKLLHSLGIQGADMTASYWSTALLGTLTDADWNALTNGAALDLPTTTDRARIVPCLAAIGFARGSDSTVSDLELNYSELPMNASLRLTVRLRNEFLLQISDNSDSVLGRYPAHPEPVGHLAETLLANARFAPNAADLTTLLSGTYIIGTREQIECNLSAMHVGSISDIFVGPDKMNDQAASVGGLPQPFLAELKRNLDLLKRG